MGRRAWMGLLLGLAMVAGCQRAEDPALAEQRQKYLLGEEPAGALGVIEVRALLANPTDDARQDASADHNPADANPTDANPPDHNPADQDFVVVGRVGAGPNQTWDPGQAAFVMMDVAAEIPNHDHGSGHEQDNCPFCQAEKKKAADMTAVVRVVAEDGTVVPLDARQLFQIEEGQLVVVRGVASIDALGNLVVSAKGVYPRR